MNPIMVALIMLMAVWLLSLVMFLRRPRAGSIRVGLILVTLILFQMTR